MIECGDEIEERKLKVGGRKIIERGRREPLELADEIITEIANRSSEKRRDIAGPHDVGIFDESGEMPEGSLSGLFVAVRRLLQIPIGFSAQCLIGVTGKE
jgi:hypothetical protein